MGKLRAGLVLLGGALLGLSAAAQTGPVRQLWQQGQEALRDHRPDAAVGYFEECLLQSLARPLDTPIGTLGCCCHLTYSGLACLIDRDRPYSYDAAILFPNKQRPMIAH